MPFGDDVYAEGAELVVTTSSAAHYLGIKFWPIFVAVPGSWMQHDDAFTRIDAVHEGFAISRRVEGFAVNADDCDVRIGELFSRLGVVFRIVNRESGF